MIDATIITALVGGGIGLITVFLKKLKCYFHRDSNGGYDMTIGLYRVTTPSVNPLTDGREKT